MNLSVGFECLNLYQLDLFLPSGCYRLRHLAWTYFFVSICNSKRGFGALDVTDRYLSLGENGLSNSVTSRTVFRSRLLQIEMFVSAPAPPLAVVPYKQTPW